MVTLTLPSTNAKLPIQLVEVTIWKIVKSKKIINKISLKQIQFVMKIEALNVDTGLKFYGKI